MQERTLEELYKKLKEFDRLTGKEEFLFDEIRDAVEAQDLAFAAQICDFVLNDDFEKFGAVLRTRALMWLTDYIVQNLNRRSHPMPRTLRSRPYRLWRAFSIVRSWSLPL